MDATAQIIAIAGTIVTALWGATIALARIIYQEKSRQVSDLEAENKALQQAASDLLRSYQARDAEDLKAYRKGRRME